MPKKKGFTLIELLVVISIIDVLMAILMPALRRTREQAHMLGCSANLRQWLLVLNTYCTDNDGNFFSGVNEIGHCWPCRLSEDLKNWRKNKIWFCPTAMKTIIDEFGNSSQTFDIDRAWGIFTGAHGDYSCGKNRIFGGYGLNSYSIPIPSHSSYVRNIPASNGYRKFLEVPHRARVPVLMDGLRFDLFPIETEDPPEYEYDPWNGESGMKRVCINRHRGAIPSSFADGSVHKVPLKELWTFNWHIKFQTNGPWILAGGVTPDMWPKWIQPYPDF